MNKAALTVLTTFMEQSGSDLYSLFPQAIRAQMEEITPAPSIKMEHLRRDLLEEVHPSWFVPYLRTLSDTDIKLFLAALSVDQRKICESQLGFGNHIPELTHIAKESLRKSLTKQVTQNKTLIPHAFLPESSPNALLELTQATLKRLVRFLGLHDLSFEMRQIIDTKELKKLFAALSEKEGEFLNQLLLHREPLTFKRLFLQKWEGTKENLHSLLEDRGLHRLGHLLFGAEESLIWYLSHKLDMHQGAVLLKYLEKPTHERAAKILADQIDKILHFFSKEATL